MVVLPRNKWLLPSPPGHRPECVLMCLVPGTQLEMLNGRNVNGTPYMPVSTLVISLDSLTVLNMFLESVNAGAQSPLHFRGFAP